MKHNYTFLNPETNIFENSLHVKDRPIDAARSIFRRILRLTNEEKININLIVKDLDSEKLYYYKCMAIKNNQVKRISKYKVITIKYDINIVKLNKKCFE